MKTYEYVVEELGSPIDRTEELGMLNEMGQKGWHLSAIEDAQEGNERMRRFYFARLLTPPGMP